MRYRSITQLFYLFIFFTLLSGCASQDSKQLSKEHHSANFDKDRAAILSMAGDYEVTFDFTESVSFQTGYVLKKPYVTGATEIVRVIKNEPGFISLQHILLVGGETPHPIKHWRQDWVFEPDYVSEFVGFNFWQKRLLSEKERKGKWAQNVYQVDDSPRYSAIAKWQHQNGISSWTSPPNLRPLPRRDMTKRDDYDAILAVNRHAITPTGWVHEQDNSKLILRGHAPQLLAREVGINSYIRSEKITSHVAEEYWSQTKKYWKAVREIWLALERDKQEFGLTVQGESTQVYMPLLEYAGQLAEQKISLSEAITSAQKIIDQHTTLNAEHHQSLSRIRLDIGNE